MEFPEDAAEEVKKAEHLFIASNIKESLKYFAEIVNIYQKKPQKERSKKEVRQYNRIISEASFVRGRYFFPLERYFLAYINMNDALAFNCFLPQDTQFFCSTKYPMSKKSFMKLVLENRSRAFDAYSLLPCPMMTFDNRLSTNDKKRNLISLLNERDMIGTSVVRSSRKAGSSEKAKPARASFIDALLWNGYHVNYYSSFKVAAW